MTTSAEIVKEPIYQQLSQVLRAVAGGAEFPAGSRFLTEREICRRYGVSRATANKCLSSLVSEGVLEFRKGVGTFVRGRAMDYNLRALVSFTDEARAAGKEPSTQVLHFERVRGEAVPDDVAALLGTGYDETVFALERLRLAGGLPVILERRHVVARYCPDLSEADAAGSLYALWTGRYRLDIAGADQTIRAVNIRGGDARALGVREGAAGLLVTSVGYLSGDRPLWHEKTLYRGQAYEFHNRLGPIQPAGEPLGKFL